MSSKPINLVDLMHEFCDETKCRRYIERLRWPHGAECPRCESPKVYRLENRPLLLCASCEHQFSATAGTIFHDTHLPLTKWFLALSVIVDAKKGISAKQLQRHLNVGYKTAWYLAHRIRKAMEETGSPLLTGTVEID